MGHGAPGAVKGDACLINASAAFFALHFVKKLCVPTSSSHRRQVMTAWADCSSDALKLYPLISRKRTRQQAHAFVAINEGMILHDCRGVGGSLVSSRACQRGRIVAWPCQGGGQESRVAKATGAAMEAQQFRM